MAAPEPLTDDQLREVYAQTKTIAVVGASNDPAKAANQIGSYLKRQGYRIVPVNPKGGEILGEKAYTSLAEIDVPIDVVDVFRPSEETPEIAREAVAIGAKVLWLQREIASDEAAEIADSGGLKVVMDTCMGETHARLGLGGGPYKPDEGESAVSPQRRLWTLVAVILGSGIVFLDSTLVNVALPRIGQELSSSLFQVLEGQSYVYYGYLLSLSALLILAGALSDYYGRKRLFSIGLVGFGVTSLLCGLATNMEMLIAFRVLQGAAGAILVPGSLALITSTFKGEEQGRAFGIWAGASAATTIFGPVLGGALVSFVSWRAAFLINIPLIAVAVWATARHVLETRDDEATGRFDWFGAMLVFLAVGGLSFGTIRGQAQEWQDATAFVALAIGGLATIALPVAMMRSDHPLMPPSLFRSRNFTITNISTLLIYGAMYVTFYLLPLYLIGVVGYNPLGFGVGGIVMSLFLVLFSTKFGALAVRYGPRIFMTVGPALIGAGMLLLGRIPATSDPWAIALEDLSTLVPPRGYLVDLLPPMIVFGIGLMIMVAPLTAALMRSVPERHAGVGSAINNAISRVGPQLAGALVFVAITASFYSALTDRLPQVEVGSDSFREQVTPLNPPAEDVPEEVAAQARDASTDSFQLAMMISALLCFAGAAVNALGIQNPPRKTEPEKPVITCPGISTPAVEAGHGASAA
ncbi:MAG TPA: DHA2 family efflux MFS transporter permease subunit [Actinomycetota bacterium]|nr:DHA2 family efflux MFS transporter permease subunit [Actinomycetota bacterium]